MSEKINEDNCVLNRHDLKNINVLITHYLQTVDKYYRKKAEKSLDITFKKILKLNDMAKEKQNG